MQRDAILQSIGSSAFSSSLTATLLQPLDRLKTIRQQLNHQHQNSWHHTKVLVKKEGVRSLWTGLSPTLVRVVPGASLYLSLVNSLRIRLKIGDKDVMGLFLSGFGARSMVAILMQPATVIKTRLESSLYPQTHIISTFQDIFKSNGIKGLWRGLVPTLLRDSPFSGLYLVFYRRQLQFFTNENESKNLFATRLFCGFNAGLLACLLTQPFDIIKTVVLLYPKKFVTSFGASKDLYKFGGAKIFFTGFVLRATKRTLTAAINWALFEEFLNYYNHHHNSTGQN